MASVFYDSTSGCGYSQKGVIAFEASPPGTGNCA